MNIAVVGGGISGIRAALTLARGGATVTLLEKSRYLGGRVFSFHTPDFGEVDIGQHVWLRCCTAFEQLLRDLAVPEAWIYRQDRVAMTYRWPDRTVRTLAAVRLPGGLGTLPMLLGARLSVADKLSHLRCLARAWLYSKAALEALDGISVAEWLAAQGQSRAVVESFWEPFLVGICNGRLSEVSARHGLFAVRESVMKSGRAAAICLLRRPLSEVFNRHATKKLRDAGVNAQPGVHVRELQPGSPVVSVDGSGAKRPFDKVILALPLKRARAILPQAQLPEPPQEGAIAGLLLRFAGPVMDELFFTAVASPVQIVFNKSAIWNHMPADGSQVIELVISAAEREVRLGVEQVAPEMLPALATLLPRVANTPVLAKRLLVHATATFRVTPGGEQKRLAMTRPELANVIFAGDYAATGWPSTMESATRAGHRAAELALGDVAPD